MRPSTSQASQDERLLAAVAHGAAMLPFFGIIVPLYIWITQKDWSKCVRFHAIQALIHQMVLPAATLAVYLVGVWGFYGTLMSRLLTGPYGTLPTGMLALRCILVIGVLGGWGLTITLGLMGMSRTLAGRDFLYPFIGRWVASHINEGEIS
ncbi:MAG: hypothetical protein AMJ88_11100 [Anaerolineae bacterium SM23_ 63]|nr:MAG: hypothetical protein AMJ88_11100 [Anaerolineae bacterium SM23_ 63]HEY47103.1 DUF4870 domain-containing protein [Anaerolineae bacterium]